MIFDIPAGHEAAFAAFLCCLCKIGVLMVDDQLAIIFRVFDRYAPFLRGPVSFWGRKVML